MAKDSLLKASTPEPFSQSKTSNWVARAGGLPDYIEHVAHGIQRSNTGLSDSEAIQRAIGVVKRWAAGGGGVDANTKAAAAKAIAEWEALKAKNRAKGGKVSEAPTGALALEVTAEDLGDLSLLEAAAKPTPMSSTPRRPGESLTAWGKRLQAGDKTLAAKQAKTKTRSGASSSDFNTKHPRGRGGKWVFKQGASGAEVRGIQRRVGAKVDGAFGTKTKAAIERFQRQHGLVVDGVVGRQTVAAMRGRKGKVTPGSMGPKDRAWLAGHPANRGR